MTDTTPTPPDGDRPAAPITPPANQTPQVPPVTPPEYHAPLAPPVAPPAYESPVAPPAYQPGMYPADPGMPPQYGQPVQRAPFSKAIIVAFVFSCVSIFAFGFLGILGVVVATQALRSVRAGQTRGRGLGIAAIVIGLVGFVFYAIGLIFSWAH